MKFLRHGYVTGPLDRALWMMVVGFTVAVAMSFATGEAFQRVVWLCVL